MPTEEYEIEEMSFGENLRRLRRQKGLTQAELAKVADVKISHMSKLENDSGDPKLSTLYKLMNALECSADTLLIDESKVSLDGILQAAFESAQHLPPGKKAIVVDLIESYCRDAGMEVMFNKKGFLYKDGPTRPLADYLAKDE